jgi:hypothetical protein
MFHVIFHRFVLCLVALEDHGQIVPLVNCVVVCLMARRSRYALGYERIVTYSYRMTQAVYSKRLLAVEKYICGHTKVETCGLPVQ